MAAFEDESFEYYTNGEKYTFDQLSAMESILSGDSEIVSESGDLTIELVGRVSLEDEELRTRLRRAV